MTVKLLLEAWDELSDWDFGHDESSNSESADFGDDFELSAENGSDDLDGEHTVEEDNDRE
jgi:hypothetical protein